jgi:hypothetical protein
LNGLLSNSKKSNEMNANTLLSFLGCTTSDAQFDSFLTAHRIYARPHTQEEDDEYADDVDAAYENARLSLINDVERESIALVYEERNDYIQLFGRVNGEGDFVLKQLAFYGADVMDHRGFSGQLPRSLTFSDSRADVHAKLGSPVANRRIRGLFCDLYLTSDLCLNVSYRNDEGPIDIVHVRRPHLFDLRMLKGTQAECDKKAVNLAELTKCLGKSAYDSDLESLLRPMGWQSTDFSMADCDEVPNLIDRFGLTLYYRDAKHYSTLDGKTFVRDGAVFAGFRVNRLGDMGSRGFKGSLPFGIEFHHTPRQVIAIVGRDPDWTSIGPDIGALKWKLPHHTLHVMFSLIDCQIYRVSCFAKFMEPELFKRSSTDISDDILF